MLISATIPHRRLSLDGLRGLAVFAVLVHHLFLFAPPTWLGHVSQSFAEAGYMGVDLFFVLSGYLITGILIDTRDREDYYPRFLLRRSLRIFPLYYAVLIFVFVVFRPLVGARTNLSPVAGEPVAYFAYLSNFTIVGAGDFSWRPTDVTWSLSVEEQFYLAFPWLVRFLPVRRLIPTFVGLVGLALVTRTAFFLAEGDGAWLACYVLPFCRMDALALGAVWAALERNPTPALASALARTSDAALLALPVVVFENWAAHSHPFMMTVGYTVTALAMLSLVRLALGTSYFSSKVLCAAPLTHLGTRSYGIYLLHSLVEGALRRVPGLRDYFSKIRLHDQLLPALLFFGASVALTLVIAEVSYRFFEQPLLALRERSTAT